MDPGATMASARARALPPIARYTWARQWRAEGLIGLCSGIFGLAAFAAERSLGGPDWIVPLITVAGQVPWILAPAWEPLFARIDPQRAFLWLGALSKGALLLVLFVHVERTGAEGEGTGNLPAFVVAVVMFYIVDGAYIPHRSALLRANFSTPVRGRMFGLLSTVALVASMIGSKGGGWLLDRDARWLRLLFPIAAVSGILGHVFLSRIRWRRDGDAPVPAEPGLRAAGRAFVRAWAQALRVLARDRDFRWFEIAFMLYGFGLLMCSPLLVIYAQRDLRLSYGEWTWAQGFVSPLAQLSSVWLAGRLADRLGVARSTGIAFAVLGVFFAVMPFVDTAGGLEAAYVLLGLGMAGVIVGWNVGPLRFAPAGRARTYTGAHVLLVGVRSGTAPFFGYGLARLTSIQTAFAVAAGLMALAALTQARLGRRVR
jgi:MFS family permease